MGVSARSGFVPIGEVALTLLGKPVNFGATTYYLTFQKFLFKKFFNSFVNCFTFNTQFGGDFVDGENGIIGLSKHKKDVNIRVLAWPTSTHTSIRRRGRINYHVSNIFTSGIRKSGNIKSGRVYLLANDCQGRTQVTMVGNGPEGPAVVEPMKANTDRARKYEAGPQSATEISDEQLPEEGAHKDQLQGIVARHPIAPDVREANE